MLTASMYLLNTVSSDWDNSIGNLSFPDILFQICLYSCVPDSVYCAIILLHFTRFSHLIISQIGDTLEHYLFVF